jgi:hypothetical protein
MPDTPQRRAWLAGRDAGEADALATLNTPAIRFAAQRELPADRDLWPAWIQGYGYGISGTVPHIPGHCLSSVIGPGRPMRTELTRD